MLTLLGIAMATPLPELEWTVVNDTVMGGVSVGELSAPSGVDVRFTGSLSLEQNGGFVSIRTRPTELGLGSAKGLDITLRGDGRTWSVNAYRDDVPIRAGSYRTEVSTEPDGLTRVKVWFESFRPTSFGRPVDGAPALDTAPGRIRSLGFLLADKQPGPFALDVVSITPIDGARTPTGSRDDVVRRLRQTVGKGVEAFNRGAVEACRDLYAETLEDLQSHSALTDGEQHMLRDAQREANAQDARSAAWTLRHAIDSVLAGT